MGADWDLFLLKQHMFRSTICIIWLVVFGIGEQMLLEGRFQSGQDFFSGSVENFGRAGAQAPRHSGGQAATWRGDEAAKQEAVRPLVALVKDEVYDAVIVSDSNSHPTFIYSLIVLLICSVVV